MALVNAPAPLSIKKISIQLSRSNSLKANIEVVTQYPQCFNEVVKFQGEYHILLAPNVPRCTACCPFTKKCAIKELDEMVRNNNMTKIEDGEPTQCVRSLVYHRKQNERLWFCLDPKDLNAAIQRGHHVNPKLEVILPKLTDVKVFSIVDAKCGYWNVLLDKQSYYVTTFSS